MDVPFELLDKEISRAVRSVRASRAELMRSAPDLLDPALQSPLAEHRRVSSRATFRELREIAQKSAPPGITDVGNTPETLPTGLVPPIATSSPLIGAMLAWLYALTLDRVLWSDEVRLTACFVGPTIAVDHPELGRLRTSPREIIVRVLRETDPARRRAWADALAGGASRVSDAARVLAERRAEAVKLLDAHPDDFEVPASPPALSAITDRLLARSEDLVPNVKGDYTAALSAALAKEQGEGWPARLTPRWLEQLVHTTGLTEGLHLSLDPLPTAIGATSFARALGILGGALADADGPKDAPFSLAEHPFDLRRARRSALLAGLVGDPLFHGRVLGLPRARAHDQARSIARALLRSLRVDIARVKLRGVLLFGEREREIRFEEVTAGALGAPIPPVLAGVVPRLTPSDAVRLVGVLAAAVDRRSLIERFDEDWFRNPRAARAIREEDAVVPSSTKLSDQTLEDGAGEIIRFIESLG